MDIGGSYSEADDDAGPGHQRVQTKAVEGLARNRIVSEIGFASESAASVCASELTDRDSETVNQFQRRVVSDLFDQLLPYHLLDAPEVGSLSDECGAMYLCHSREEMRVVSSEIVIDSLVLVQ